MVINSKEYDLYLMIEKFSMNWNKYYQLKTTAIHKSLRRFLKNIQTAFLFWGLMGKLFSSASKRFFILYEVLCVRSFLWILSYISGFRKNIIATIGFYGAVSFTNNLQWGNQWIVQGLLLVYVFFSEIHSHASDP